MRVLYTVNNKLFVEVDRQERYKLACLHADLPVPLSLFKDSVIPENIIKLEQHENYLDVTSESGKDRVFFKPMPDFVPFEPELGEYIGAFDGKELKRIKGLAKKGLVTFLGGLMIAGSSYGLGYIASGLSSECAFNLEMEALASLPTIYLKCHETGGNGVWFDLGDDSWVIVRRSKSNERMRILPMLNDETDEWISADRKMLVSALKDFKKATVRVYSDSIGLITIEEGGKVRRVDSNCSPFEELFLSAELLISGLKGCRGQDVTLKFNARTLKHHLIDSSGYKFVFMGAKKN